MQSADRYVVRPATGAPNHWEVWDTVRDEPVFGAQALQKKMQASLRGLSMKLTGGGTLSERLPGND
jgi:hypothetical protein